MIRIYDGNKEMAGIEKILNRSQMDSREVLEQVDEILENVRTRGDEALLEYTHKFDGNDLTSLRVTREEIEQAQSSIDPGLEVAIRRAMDNIWAFHENQVGKDFYMSEGKDILLGQMVSPIERVGIYVPGGTASYPSTVLMNAIPAKIAGVERIIMVTPADRSGKLKDSVLVAAELVGVDEIYKLGGAQAVGALCYGTESIPRVDKIVGPGNIYVAMAKRKLSGLVGIDMIAGPSEVLILADEKAQPRYIAADMIAQAEHDTRAAAVLVTDSMGQAEAVKAELAAQLEGLSRGAIAREALENYGAIIVVEDREEMFTLANRLAPEHLELMTETFLQDYKKIKHAGAIFLGDYTPEPVGDYYAGANHTLPTSRTARFSSALGVYDFCKKTSLVYYSKNALMEAGEDIMTLAKDEGLTGHGRSVKVRMEEEDG